MVDPIWGKFEIENLRVINIHTEYTVSIFCVYSNIVEGDLEVDGGFLFMYDYGYCLGPFLNHCSAKDYSDYHMKD